MGNRNPRLGGKQPVTRLIDTNVVIRYLVADVQELADVASRLIDSSEEILITDVVILESAFVLSKLYKISRETVVDYLITFLQKENITILNLDKGEVLKALLLCRPSNRVSFADALIWAAARSNGYRTIYSFDNKFPPDGIELRREI